MIATSASSYYSPLNVYNTSMRPNILLMCKFLFLLFIAHGFLFKISDPFLPFIGAFDVLRTTPNIFKVLLQTLFISAGSLLLINIRVRSMSVILGVVIIIVLLSSKPIFRNHLFIGGCVFLLSGLTDKKHNPWLLYIQLSLVYFGAVLNKVFQIDWWNGQFMYNWMVNARQNEIFITVADFLPEMWLAKLFSWSSMFIELLIGVLILIKKKQQLAVWIIILFHTILYSMTAFRFGHFYEDIVIILLIFLSWPTTKIIVNYNKVKLNWFFWIPKLFNNSEFIGYSFFKTKEKDWLKVTIDGLQYINFPALCQLLLYNPLFYFALFMIDLAVRFMFNGITMHLIYMLIYWPFIGFFLIVSLKKDKSYLVK